VHDVGREEDPTHPQSLLVMSFNTANDLIAPDDLIAAIERPGTMLAGLQELSPHNADALQQAPFDALPHRVLRGAYIDGKALLSRFPIDAHEFFPLTSERTAIDATIRIGDRAVCVFVVHPPPPNHRRLEVRSPESLPGIQRVLARVTPDLPTLLIGDFNFVWPGAGYRLLRRAGFIDAFRVAGSGRGRTFPAPHAQARVPLPRLMRLDYIWVSRHFRPVRSWVGAPAGSDHLPVYAELVLQP
jgi:endonuclease/exonuclease/phosphatase family metal-dependent hydrolase